jgi:alpha-mannosidase
LSSWFVAIFIKVATYGLYVQGLVEFILAGNAHIDPVWLWRWFEGYWTVRYTVRRVVDLMEKYPSMIFVFSSSIMYRWLEECEPLLFERVKKLVEEGRWIPVGGWIVEPDCNIPCGESYIRQALYGKRYFKEKLGVDVVVGYNIDSFGHNAMLPQILRKSGYKYYIFMRPNNYEKNLPTIFLWESPDGSRILAYRHPVSYALSGNLLIEALESLSSNPPLPVVLILFGRGDHGGGPTDSDMKALDLLVEKLGGASIKFADPEKFFKRIMEMKLEIPVVRDELQHHAVGCYSVLSEIKALNRRAEYSLMAAERLSTLAYLIANLSYPRDRLRRGWMLTLFCQFHDSLAGTCIPDAYADIRSMYGESINLAYESINLAAQRISSMIDTKDGRALIVFNPTGLHVTFPIEVEPWPGDCMILDPDGDKPIPIQYINPSSITGRRRVLFFADVPALGYKSYKLVDTPSAYKYECEGVIEASDTRMENDYFVVEVDSENGCIKTLYDKRIGVNIFRGYGASPILLKDESDTWSHGVSTYRYEEGRFKDAEVSLIESGPIRATLSVKARFSNSIIQQNISLYRNLDFIDVRVKLDWREKHRMLKLSFPVNLDSSIVTYEIPYGTIARIANGEEEPGQRWVDVSGTLHTPRKELDFGLTLINDSKYGFDVYGSELRMSVLRSPAFAHHDPYKLKPSIDYQYIDQGIHTFRYILIPHTGSWKTVFHRISEIAEIVNAGFLPLRFSLVNVKPYNVILSTLKLSEEFDDLIVRLVEYTGTECESSVTIPILDRDMKIHVKPFEIKTLRIPVDKSKPVVECDLLENPIE